MTDLVEEGVISLLYQGARWRQNWLQNRFVYTLHLQVKILISTKYIHHFTGPHRLLGQTAYNN